MLENARGNGFLEFLNQILQNFTKTFETHDESEYSASVNTYYILSYYLIGDLRRRTANLVVYYSHERERYLINVCRTVPLVLLFVLIIQHVRKMFRE